MSDENQNPPMPANDDAETVNTSKDNLHETPAEQKELPVDNNAALPPESVDVPSDAIPKEAVEALSGIDQGPPLTDDDIEHQRSTSNCNVAGEDKEKVAAENTTLDPQ